MYGALLLTKTYHNSLVLRWAKNGNKDLDIG